MVFDKTDTSTWRSFVRENFRRAARLYRQYEPGKLEAEVAKVQRLVYAVPRSEWSFLVSYLRSRRVGSPDLDDEIAAGSLERAKVIVEFFETTDKERFSIQEDKEVLQYWTQQYKAGEISKENYLRFAHCYSLRVAALSTPLLVYVNLDTTIIEDGIPIIMTDVFLEEGELIAQIYEAGLNPTREMRDKVRDRDSDLAIVRKFGRDLYTTTIDIGRVIEFWANKFLEGKVTEEELRRVAQNAVRLAKAEEEFLSTFEKNRRAVIKKGLDGYFWGRSLLRMSETAIPLLENGIRPTRTLRTFIRGDNSAKIAELKRLKEETNQGRFDYTNRVQRDLEFTEFIRIANGRTDLETFEKLPILEVSDEPSPLKRSERMEARATAYEDANLYWFIEGGLDPRKEKVVIGNDRFGYRFYIDPLRPDLEDLGISVSSYGYYIHSMIPHDLHDFETVLPNSFAEYLAQRGYPNVIVVDGSKDALRVAIPRLPSAHVGYLGWFLAFNEALGVRDYLTPSIEQVLTANPSYGKLVDSLRGRGTVPYSISFWTPQTHSQIYIGSHLVDYRQPTTEGPQLILANPIMIPSMHPDFPRELSEHQPGYFNDPDEKIGSKSELGFTKYGLGFSYGGMSEEEYTRLVQMEIIANIPEMIRRTNPLFK